MQHLLQRGRGGIHGCGEHRLNVVGIFRNDRAITRLVGAMLLEPSDEWALQRRYMQLEGLQTLSDTAPARLPAGQR
ncbi:MAG: hypothetical protein JNL87_10345 [Burkholderiaceae bacterium]|nr:hypothetical protein [Burkholderiaceae bacterium]